ncbi:MAG: host-nuclease inhibitor Gam family protein [Ignavibacteriae bacterium]|nr:host-nuclease inhibitor Gam family protein [Ignavibacteriota bacterium]
MTTTTPQSSQYSNLLDLLALFTEGTSRIAELEQRASEHMIEFLDEIRAEYAQLQASVAEAQAAIESAVLQHPEWFAGKSTLRTPFGSVAKRKATSLDIQKPELTIALIQQDDTLDDAVYLRVVEGVNKEALNLLDDATLRRLRVRRITEEKLTVKPLSVSLGTAVKAQEQGDEERAAA